MCVEEKINWLRKMGGVNRKIGSVDENELTSFLKKLGEKIDQNYFFILF